MTISVNDDNLSIRYGNTQGEATNLGSPSAAGATKFVEIDITASELNAHTVADDYFGKTPDVVIPSGASIVAATLYVTTAFDSGGSATLDLGFLKADGTELDYNGIDVAIAETAIDAVGDVVNCDGALVGGALLTEGGYPSYGVNTATFTVGQGRLLIEYYVPTA